MATRLHLPLHWRQELDKASHVVLSDAHEMTPVVEVVEAQNDIEAGNAAALRVTEGTVADNGDAFAALLGAAESQERLAIPG